MDSQAERRQHPRFPLDTEVFSYLDGARVDTRSRDISAGGMFLRADDPGKLPMDGLVGLVFPGEGSGRHTTFLFGRVVRRQMTPIPGVGLRWESVVTVGPPADLARFLKKVLNVVATDIRSESAGRGQTKSVYRFAAASRAVPRPDHPPLRAASADGEEGFKVTDSEVAKLEVRTLRSGPVDVPPRQVSGYVAKGPTGPPPPRPGAITQLIARKDLQVAASLEAVMTSGKVDHPCRITRMGLQGMFAQTSFAPIDRSVPLTVRLEILSKGGPLPVVCVCRLQKVDDGRASKSPGLELGIDGVDEGINPGVYVRFLKWLQFNALARA